MARGPMTDRLPKKFDMRSLNSQQFAYAGLSPTEEDGIATVVHLTDSAAFNFKHGAMHTTRMMEEARGIQDPDVRRKVIWNAMHAGKHMLKAQNDLDNLRHHLAQHPLFADEVKNVKRHELGPGTV